MYIMYRNSPEIWLKSRENRPGKYVVYVKKKNQLEFILICFTFSSPKTCEKYIVMFSYFRSERHRILFSLLGKIIVEI